MFFCLTLKKISFTLFIHRAFASSKDRSLFEKDNHLSFFP